jgi:transcriptional activator of cad operon
MSSNELLWRRADPVMTRGQAANVPAGPAEVLKIDPKVSECLSVRQDTTPWRAGHSFRLAPKTALVPRYNCVTLSPTFLMDQPTSRPFVLGAWAVDPVQNSISRNGETVRLEPRMMRLLLCLADRRGDLVSADDLLDQVWPNVIVTPDSVYQAVASLRRTLGDNSKEPQYIVTVPRQGYRMLAAVNDLPVAEHATMSTRVGEKSYLAQRGRVWAAMAVVAVLAIVAIGTLSYWRAHNVVAPITSATPDAKSVAVLPFLDLTESMGEEVFADGMTEELIDKFSQIPGLRVPPPTASFWFKDKQMTIAEIAAKLDVAYVLDGSVRKSGTMMRVAARLVRASDGFVVWSRTYDRPSDDRLMIQDDIAGEVQKALVATIDQNSSTSH